MLSSRSRQLVSTPSGLDDVDDLTPGPRDHLVTRSLRDQLDRISEDFREEGQLDPVEAPGRLARHAMREMERELDGEEPAEAQARRVNRLLGELVTDPEALPHAELALPPKVLYGIKNRSPLGDPLPLAPSPATPFSQSDLLVNAEGQPNIGSELKAELASADSVDLICAFVIWTGVRHLRDSLKALVDRGGRLRVITTTYMGTTEKRAVDELFSLGAEIRVAMDARTTKLHAKAWLLERASGLTTGFVGSSNLSHSALFDGLEWNVRLSSMDAVHVINRVRLMFESHWASEHFDSYDPEVNGDELERALAEYDRRSLGEVSTISFANLEVRPYPHQQRMLDALMIERDRHDRHPNLVVAATGTGKTVVAALDYRQLMDRHGDLSLLFVAHREEILRQSLATYRAVLRRGDFGEIHGGGRLAQGRHVFAMIQSLGADRIGAIRPDEFDVVVVDEFHHAAAASYDRLLSHLEPRELLGLTATPERLDGQDVTEWFDQRIAVELRLWEAIDQGFLVPFQYFGVADGTDLSQLTWRRGGYPTDELSNVLTNDNVRVAKLLEAVQRIVLDPGRMRALGFCVSKEHARYMARTFTEAGLDSVALTGDDPPDIRDQALGALGEGKLRCVFSVEVLGEGVDVPNVDTVLLLRPTASATVFTQQLGRGLRRARDKSSLTVIDLVGQQHREFRFEDRLRAILDARRGPIIDQVEDQFPFLPAGCTVDLDRQSREIILNNLKAAVRRSRWSTLVADLRNGAGEAGLADFLDQHDLRLEDVYRGGHSWTELQRDAQRPTTTAVDPEFERRTLRALGRMTHLDDPERVDVYRQVLADESPPEGTAPDERRRRLLTMLAWDLGSGDGAYASLREYFDRLWTEEAPRRELSELLGVLDARSRIRSRPSQLPPEVPLVLHGRYSRAEVIAALGFGDGTKPKVTQGGILWVPQVNSDVFFVDLRKAERDYSPTTMYRDYAINRELFHWESQSRQHPGQPTVQRYIEHDARGSSVLLFVREKKTFELGTQPFTFLGPVKYVDHEGERPVAFTWRLPVPMPEELFEVARSVAAA
jgi:superfamily II DNA or RNA helicase/HKD family nuclease